MYGYVCIFVYTHEYIFLKFSKEYNFLLLGWSIVVRTIQQHEYTLLCVINELYLNSVLFITQIEHHISFLIATPTERCWPDLQSSTAKVRLHRLDNEL